MRRLILLLALLMIVTGCAPKAPTTSENATANVTAAPINETVTQENKTETPEQVVHTAPSTTGAFLAVIKVKNADTLTSLASINMSVREVDIESGNKTAQWVKVATTRTYPNLLAGGTDGFLLGLNQVPAQSYKSIRIQLATGGDASTESKLISYSVPFQYVQFVKPFEVKPDQTLTFVFEMDLAQSVTDMNGSVLVKPSGVATLLTDATTAQNGAGRISVSGGTEVFSFAQTFENLLPAGTLDKVVADCKKACPDNCGAQSDDCKTACRSAVSVGCQIGGQDCQDRCTPYVSPWICRDSCNEAKSVCTSDLSQACGNSCEKTYSDPCVVTCESACGS